MLRKSEHNLRIVHGMVGEYPWLVLPPSLKALYDFHLADAIQWLALNCIARNSSKMVKNLPMSRFMSRLVL